LVLTPESGGRAFRAFGIFTAKPLVEQTNGFTYSLNRAVCSDGNRRAVEPTVEHESLPPTPVRPKKHMPLAVALKASFRADGTDWTCLLWIKYFLAFGY
jgi:hypothetical protein